MNDPQSPALDNPDQTTPNPTPQNLVPVPPPAQPAETAAKPQEPDLPPGVHKPLAIGVLGKIDSLSEAEQIELMACEEVISSGWQTFVDVGLALARIRDADLYRHDYGTFDHYCRLRWQYKRSYAYDLIAAAKVSSQLSLKKGQIKPDHASELLPLVGLPLEQAKAAWKTAVDRAQGQRITDRLVKNVLKTLNAPELVSEDPQDNRPQFIRGAKAKAANVKGRSG